MSHPHKDYGLLRPPGARLLHHLRLRFASRHAHGGKRSMYAELNLTSMVDMLTILVVFLLQTFSASGELYTQSPNIKLPQASRYIDLVQMPLVVVTTDGVAYEGKPCATRAELETTESQTPRIDCLAERLEESRKTFLLNHKPEDFVGQFMLQADKGIPYKFIRRVCYTGSQTYYTKVNLLVEQMPQPAQVLPEHKP